MPPSRSERPRTEAPLTDAERGVIVGAFQDWLFGQLGQIPAVKDQLFQRFKGPSFNVAGNDGGFHIGNYHVSVKNNISGNWHIDDTTQLAQRQVVVRVKPVADTQSPEDYFTVFTVCQYEGDPKTYEINRFTDGELQLYETDKPQKTLIGDPDGVVDAAKQALTRVFSSGLRVDGQSPGTPAQ